MQISDESQLRIWPGSASAILLRHVFMRWDQPHTLEFSGPHKVSKLSLARKVFTKVTWHGMVCLGVRQSLREIGLRVHIYN